MKLEPKGCSICGKPIPDWKPKGSILCSVACTDLTEKNKKREQDKESN